jgi:hypothetical protein
MGPNAVMLSAGRTQGGIKGKRAKPNEEWLTCVARAVRPLGPRPSAP